MNRTITKALSGVLWGAVLSISAPSQAAVVQLYEVPTTWKLENYVGGVVTTWYTGATCPDGRLSFPSTASIDEVNRYFALILAAKVSSKMVFVRYDNISCNIDSFGMHN